MTAIALPVLTALPDDLRCRTTAQVAAATGLAAGDVARALALLERARLVVRMRRGCYRLSPKGIKAREAAAAGGADLALDAGPGLRADTLPERVWSALRKRRKATIAELIELAARGNMVSARAGASRYLRTLARFDYVARLGRPMPPRWVLLKDTGARAPRPIRDFTALWDPNVGRVVEATPAGGRP